MSVIFMDGFGQFANLGNDTPAHLVDAAYSVSGLVTVVGGPESGTNAVQIPRGGSFGRTFHFAGPRFAIGWAYWASARDVIASLSGIGTLAWPGGVELLGVSSTAVPIPNLWAYFELVIDKEAATVELWQNDRLEITAALPSGVQDLTSFSLGFGSSGSEGPTRRVSGLYCGTDRLGPIAIETDMPNSDSEVAWVPTAGTVHYTQVNTRPPNDETFVQSAQSGAQDLFLFPRREIVDPIVAVGFVARACKTDLDMRQLGIVVGAPANQQEVITSDLLLDYRYHYAVYQQAPSGSAWTPEDLELEPAGVVVRP